MLVLGCLAWTLDDWLKPYLGVLLADVWQHAQIRLHNF